MDRRQFLAGVAAVGAGAAGLASATAAQAAGDVTIGLSNGYFGTEWRDQMVAGAQAQLDMYKAQGKASKLIVQQAGADINQQIQDIRNMILQGVSVITMDPNSGTALDSLVNEAKRAGIPVIAFDQAVKNHYALSVTIDHYVWATRYADWIAKTLNGKGKVVVMDGLPGNPAAETRRKAAFDVFRKYPGIDIVWSGYGFWDQAKAQAVMATVIAAQPQIDGAFVEDSMGLGVLRAFQNARRPIPVMTGEAQKAFLIAWKKELDSGTKMQAFAQPNPPDISRNAIGIAVRLAAGRKLKPQADNTIYYPIHLEVTRDNLDQTLAGMKDQPDSYFLAEWFSEPQLDALFT
jgi:ribose transport system substrate-binding protein